MTTQEEIKDDPNYMPLLDYGFAGLVDHLGDDSAIVQAARVSYGAGTKKVSEDRALIRYLMRHHHTSPIEMVVMKLHLKMPIFVARQLVRHRTASLNEYSGRYSLMSDEFYIPEPEHIQPQSSDNKQGRAGEIDDVSKAGVKWLMKTSFEQSYAAYNVLLGEREAAEQHYDAYSDESPLLSDSFPGVAREVARIVLPVANYTEMYWRIDLSNLFKLLKLRADAHAQYEIRVYADAIFKLIQPIVPAACEAFTDYMMEAASVSRMELALLRELLAEAGPGDIAERAKQHGLTKREIAEFQTRFGL